MTVRNLSGTTLDDFQIGLDGPRFKRFGNALALLRDDDVAFAALFCVLLNRQTVASDAEVKSGYSFTTTDLEVDDGVCLEIEDGATVVVE